MIFLRQLLNLLYSSNPAPIQGVMTESSPLKLHPINKCFNLDHLVHRFINDQQSSNESPNFFYSPPKKSVSNKKKSSFKSSLADWRCLYGESQRPKTHSLISYPKTQRFLEKKFSNPQHPLKPKTSYHLSAAGSSSRFTNRNKLPNGSLTNRSVGKNLGVLNPEYSKTTFSFYEGSMRDELQVYGKLTSEYKNATQTNFKINKKKPSKAKMDGLYH